MPQNERDRFFNWEACHSKAGSLTDMPYDLGVVHPTSGDYLAVCGREHVAGQLAAGYKILDVPRFHRCAIEYDVPANFITLSAMESLPTPFYGALGSTGGNSGRRKYFPSLFPY
jgi:hypothetical protein